MVLLTQQATILLADIFCVDAFVVAAGESIIDPQEGAYLTACQRLLQHLNAIWAQAYNLPRPYVTQDAVVEVGETGRLAGHCVCLDMFVRTDG